ncbi:MAG: hypothetical protein KKI06_09615, partial [Euryarchaeota archaeon]|nr:hypothetical protein [Euryarchaeota archaeon]
DYGKIVALDSPAQLKDHIVGDGVTLKPHTFDMEKLRKLEYVRKIEEKDGLLYLSIKDVFMHYTGREIREGEGEGGFWERMMKK